MAREFAQIKLSIWSDDDYRSLTHSEQWLYEYLLTSPSLSHAGVADWRPKRIAAHARDLTAEDVERIADGLIAKQFILVDESTEEVLIRSFVRHDGLMKQPKMATAMATAHTAVISTVLRGVIVHELKRLREDYPDLKGWGSEKASDLLRKGSVDPSTYPLGKRSTKESGKGLVKGSGKGNPTPTGKGSTKGCPTPAPTPTPATSTSTTPDGVGAAAPPTAPDEITVQTVVAAWVDASRANGAAPSGSQIGQVGKLAKELLAKNDPHRVLAAAEAAGRKGFATIDRELTTLAARNPRPSATDEIDPDAVLGPDYWSPPTPPLEIDEGPPEQRREWFRKVGEAHQAERLAEAQAALARSTE